MKRTLLGFNHIVGLCVTLLGLAVAGLAQTPPTNNPNSGRTTAQVTHTIRGKIFLPSGTMPDQRMRVVLEVTTGGVAQEVFSDSIGDFEFRSVSNNSYRVTVPSDHQSYDAAQEQLEVYGTFSRTFMVQIYLKEKTSEFGGKTNNKMLSAVEFTQDVPKAAKKSYEQGVKRAKDGKTEEAVASFREALKLYPDYLLALNRLGEQYMLAHQIDQAQAFFERALTVNAKFALAHINLGIICVEQKRFPEAIEHLEAANHADESYPMTHVHLGRALMEKNPPEFDRAEHELLRARELGGTEFAYARLHLFNLYFRRQAYDKAVGQLEAYLKDVPNASNAPAVRETRDRIKKQMVQQAESTKKQ